jgi:hypothetical protein
MAQAPYIRGPLPTTAAKVAHHRAQRRSGDARDVTLDVWGATGDGGRAEANRVEGEEKDAAERLQVGEPVHLAVAFSMGKPQAEDLRYRYRWTDGRGGENSSPAIAAPSTQAMPPAVRPQDL